MGGLLLTSLPCLRVPVLNPPQQIEVETAGPLEHCEHDILQV